MISTSAAELKFEGETLNAVRKWEIQVVYELQHLVLNEKFTSMTVLFVACCPLLL